MIQDIFDCARAGNVDLFFWKLFIFRFSIQF